MPHCSQLSDSKPEMPRNLHRFATTKVARALCCVSSFGLPLFRLRGACSVLSGAVREDDIREFEHFGSVSDSSAIPSAPAAKAPSAVVDADSSARFHLQRVMAGTPVSKQKRRLR
jgi:hypothetical protein